MEAMRREEQMARLAAAILALREVGQEMSNAANGEAPVDNNAWIVGLQRVAALLVNTRENQERIGALWN